jgi:hypothetical protein
LARGDLKETGRKAVSEERAKGRLFSTETKRRAKEKPKRTIGEEDNIVLRLRKGKTCGGKVKK